MAFAWLGLPSVIFGIIGAYLLGHFALRLMLSPTLGIDDAEQVLFAQHWAFSYRFRQPPLFTWMLLPVIDLVGPGVLAVSIVRYVLLGVTFAFFYLTARTCLHDQRMAGLAVLSFSLIYVFAYYAHHDLTHTTALGAIIALALYLATKLIEQPSLGAYSLLGLAFGFGMLAKWNFLMLALGLPLACLYTQLRHLVLTPKIFAAMATMAAVVAPTGLWMFTQGQSIESVSSNILSREGDIGHLALWLEGGGALLRSAILFPLPFFPIFLLVFGRSLASGLKASAPIVRSGLPPSFFGSLMLIVLGLHALLIPLFGAVNFTERWLHPALMVLPIFLFAIAERGYPSKRQIALYLTLIAILVAAAAGARLYRYVEGADDCGKCREFAPFEELAEGLRQAGFSHGTIVADGMHIGGNLRMLFSESRVIDPAFPRALWPDVTDGDGPFDCVLVWRDQDGTSETRRDVIRGYARRELGLPEAAEFQAGRLYAPLIGSSSRRYGLGFELYQEDTGGCR